VRTLQFWGSKIIISVKKQTEDGVWKHFIERLNMYCLKYNHIYAVKIVCRSDKQ
jgi:hypothetical protein